MAPQGHSVSRQSKHDVNSILPKLDTLDPIDQGCVLFGGASILELTTYST